MGGVTSNQKMLRHFLKLQVNVVIQVPYGSDVHTDWEDLVWCLLFGYWVWDFRRCPFMISQALRCTLPWMHNNAVTIFVMVHKHRHVVVPVTSTGITLFIKEGAAVIMHLSQDNFFSAFVICLHSNTQRRPSLNPQVLLFSAKFFESGLDLVSSCLLSQLKLAISEASGGKMGEYLALE